VKAHSNSSSKAKRKQHQQLPPGHRAQQLLHQLIVLLRPAARPARTLQCQKWPSWTALLIGQLQPAATLLQHQQKQLLLQIQQLQQQLQLRSEPHRVPLALQLVPRAAVGTAALQQQAVLPQLLVGMTLTS
jgi:hypothetical protein